MSKSLTLNGLVGWSYRSIQTRAGLCPRLHTVALGPLAGPHRIGTHQAVMPEVHFVEVEQAERRFGVPGEFTQFQ